MLEEAIKNGDYKYLHLISVQDLPIKSQDYIHDYLESSDTEFVGIMNDCGNIQSRIIQGYVNVVNKMVWSKKQ